MLAISEVFGAAELPIRSSSVERVAQLWQFTLYTFHKTKIFRVIEVH